LQIERYRLQSAISRILGTALLEIRLNLLSPAPWIMGLVLAGLGYLAVRTAPDPSSFPLAWALSAEIGPLAVILLVFLAASFAHRPLRYDVTEVQDSKIVASEELILGRWLGMLVGVLVPLVIQYLVTLAAQKIHARPVVLPLAYLQSFERLLPPVLFLTSLSFFLVTVTRNLILGGGLAGLLWFVLYFGPAYYPTVFRIDLSQNAPVFLGLMLSVLLLMLLGYQGRRRAKQARATYILAWAAGLVFAATAVQAAWSHLSLPGKASAVASWNRLRESGRRTGDPLPNFAWVDLHGQRVSLASLRGKPALLVFFQPKDSGLLPLLQRLTALREKFKGDGLSVLGICLSEDLNAGRDAARLAGAAALPVVTDWGAPASGPFNPRAPASVVSFALRVGSTPSAVLVDDAGKELTRKLPLSEEQWQDLELQLRAALDGEPVEPELPQGLMQGAVR
jgi:AhpC/TSA family protein